MSWLFEKEQDPRPALNKCVTSIIGTYKDKKIEEWKTPYGVTFSHGEINGFYFYEYDKELYMGDNNQGCLSGNDIIKTLKQLKENPDKLRKKPDSILLLEKELGVVASRHHSQFGKWHVATDEYSLINNPFGLSLGYCDNENEFELFFFDDNDPIERISAQQALSEIKQRGLL